MWFERKVEQLFTRKDSAKYRPIIWQTIGRFSIEPPERFFGNGVARLIREQRDIQMEETLVHRELYRMVHLGMAERLPEEEATDTVVWWVRSDQEKWDAAQGVLMGLGIDLKLG